MSRRGIRRTLVGVTVALTLAAVPAVADPGRAGAARAATPFALAAQPAWTPLGGDATFDVTVPAAAAALSVRVTAHNAVTTRSAFDKSLGAKNLGAVLGRTTATVASLPATGQGVRRVTVQLPDAGGSRGPNGLPIRRQGVYPVQLELTDPDAGTVLADFVTYVVAVDTTTVSSRPALDVAWIWQVGAAPAMTAAGTLNPEITAQFAADERLGRIANELATATDVPLSVAIVPETLDAWSLAARSAPAAAATLAKLEAGARVHQSLAGPFVNLDIPSLLAGGLASAVSGEIVRGSEVLTAELGDRVDPRTAITNPVDQATLTRLRESNVDRIVAPASAFARTTTKLTPAHPFTTPAGDGSLTVAAPDPGLSILLRATEDPALNAQRVLAGLALTAFEAPNLTRGLVLDAGSNWSPPTALLRSMLAGLRANPLLSGVSLDTLFNTIPPATNDAGPESRALEPSTPAPPIISAEEYATALANQRTLATLVAPDDAALVAGQRALFTSLSSDWGTGPAAHATAMAQFTPVNATIESFLTQIEVPSKKTVTLTAEEGDLPLSFVNHSDRPVSVKVSLVSPKLAFPDGDTKTVDLKPNATTTTTFVVQARTTGTFPLDINVTTADGRFEIEQTTITIRSTALNGVGLILTIGAGLFLAIWWLTHFRRTRAKRRGANGPSVVAAPGSA